MHLLEIRLGDLGIFMWHETWDGTEVVVEAAATRKGASCIKIRDLPN